MTRIDFYIIEDGSEQATEKFICRLTEKAWSQNNAVYLHTMDEQHATKYDELLWSFNEASFVPHQVIQTETDQSETKNVLIGHQAHQTVEEIPVTYHDVLINLNHETPSFFSQFERVAEIITTDETSRSKGRERYQFYRDRGYVLETHKLSL
jgi:DNA polymerase-3 subunit chi